MLFYILPIPLPEIKLGLEPEALFVLWIPQLTMQHSVNAYIKPRRHTARQLHPKFLARSHNIPWQWKLNVSFIPTHLFIHFYLCQCEILTKTLKYTLKKARAEGCMRCMLPVSRCCSVELMGEKTSPHTVFLWQSCTQASKLPAFLMSAT